MSDVTERVMLPSNGYPYNTDKNYVEISPFSTKAYKNLLVSTNEESFNRFIEACCHDLPVPVESLTYADKIAIIFRIRAITLGSKLDMSHKCPDCGLIFQYEWNLDEMETTYLDLEEYPVPIELTEGSLIHLKLSTQKNELDAVKILSRRSKTYKIDMSSLKDVYTLCNRIIHPDKKMDLISKVAWYLDLPLQDAMKIDEYASSLDNYGTRIRRDLICSGCGNEFSVTLVPTEEFFRPVAKQPECIKTKEGYLASGAVETVLSE